MNFSQKLGIAVLVIISVAYVYFSFFSNEGLKIKMPESDNTNIQNIEEPSNEVDTSDENKTERAVKNVKIYVVNSNGNIRSVNRKCDTAHEESCFVYAIKSLLDGPTKWEKSKGFFSEIPQGTKILSVREGENTVLVDLSSSFEAGGGAESINTRVKQVIKTAIANTDKPTYLYINGKQADVIGGEGIMIKQPLSERSLDE